MATAMADEGRKLASKVLIFQCAIALISTLLAVAIFGENVALSVGYGAVICLVPNLLFARLAFRYAGASQNQLVVRSFSQGAKLKLFTTIILFVLAFKGLSALPLPLMSGFAITLVAQWVALLGLRNV